MTNVKNYSKAALEWQNTQELITTWVVNYSSLPTSLPIQVQPIEFCNTQSLWNIQEHTFFYRIQINIWNILKHKGVFLSIQEFWSTQSIVCVYKFLGKRILKPTRILKQQTILKHTRILEHIWFLKQIFVVEPTKNLKQRRIVKHAIIQSVPNIIQYFSTFWPSYV